VSRRRRHKRRTGTGLLLQGVGALVLSPLFLLGGLAGLVVQVAAAERGRRAPQRGPSFDYTQWQTEAAARKLARNQEAYRRREERRKQAGFKGSVDELRRMMGED
jgi:hypothetical protein